MFLITRPLTGKVQDILNLVTIWRRCNACRRNLITGLTSAASPRVHISCTCKVGQKLGMSLPLLPCSPSAWPSRLLYRRGRKSRRDLWITLYIFFSNICTFFEFVVTNCLISLLFKDIYWKAFPWNGLRFSLDKELYKEVKQHTRFVLNAETLHVFWISFWPYSLIKKNYVIARV
jgi:hypothetical protein